MQTGLATWLEIVRGHTTGQWRVLTTDCVLRVVEHMRPAGEDSGALVVIDHVEEREGTKVVAQIELRGATLLDKVTDEMASRPEPLALVSAQATCGSERHQR